MYLPEAFREDRIDELHAVMRRARLAMLVTLTAEGLVASHVPMLLDADAGPYGTLLGHLASPNPQGAGAVPGTEALAIFQGPDAYITPSWYETKRQTGKVVPTWNYVAVHAYGPVRFFDDPARLRDIVTRLTERQEQAYPKPWTVSDAPADFVESMLQGIVGFAIPITRIQGKWKMSQNRPAQDLRGVIEGLEAAGEFDVAREVTQANQGRLR